MVRRRGLRPDLADLVLGREIALVSTAVVLAIDEGAIGSLDDPITTYLPELLDRDPGYARITGRHLVTMSSGRAYEERSHPWRDDAQTSYSTSKPEPVRLAIASSAGRSGAAGSFYAAHCWTGTSDGQLFPEGHVLAWGEHGQCIYVALVEGIVMVRLGDAYGTEASPQLLADATGRLAASTP